MDFNLKSTCVWWVGEQWHSWSGWSKCGFTSSRGGGLYLCPGMQCYWILSTILYVHGKLLLQYLFMWVYVYMCTCISYEKLQLSGDFVAVHAQSCSPLHVCEANSAVILHSKMVLCCHAENGNDELNFLRRKSQSFVVKDGLVSYSSRLNGWWIQQHVWAFLLEVYNLSQRAWDTGICRMSLKWWEEVHNIVLLVRELETVAESITSVRVLQHYLCVYIWHLLVTTMSTPASSLGHHTICCSRWSAAYKQISLVSRDTTGDVSCHFSICPEANLSQAEQYVGQHGCCDVKIFDLGRVC